MGQKLYEKIDTNIPDESYKLSRKIDKLYKKAEKIAYHNAIVEEVKKRLRYGK